MPLCPNFLYQLNLELNLYVASQQLRGRKKEVAIPSVWAPFGTDDSIGDG